MRCNEPETELSCRPPAVEPLESAPESLPTEKTESLEGDEAQARESISDASPQIDLRQATKVRLVGSVTDPNFDAETPPPRLSYSGGVVIEQGGHISTANLEQEVLSDTDLVRKLREQRKGGSHPFHQRLLERIGRGDTSSKPGETTPSLSAPAKQDSQFLSLSSPKPEASTEQHTEAIPSSKFRATQTSSSAPSAEAKPPENETRESFTGLAGLEAELDRVAESLGQRPGSGRSIRLAGSALSPNMMAVLGGLAGVAALVTVFGVLGKLAPRDEGLATQSTEEKAETNTDGTPASPTSGELHKVEQRPKDGRPPRQLLPMPWRISDDKDKPGLRYIHGTMGDQPFLKAVQEAGIEKNQAYRILSALTGVTDLNKCRKKDEFRILVDRASKSVQAFELIRSEEEIFQAREQEGKLIGSAVDLKIARARVQGAIAIIDPKELSALAIAAGFEADIVKVIDRAVDGSTSVSEMKPGERLRIVAQEVTTLGRFSRYAGIEALEYVPLEGDPKRFYYFEGKSGKGYFDAKGRSVTHGVWRRPVDGPVTSHFNPKRFHPVLKKIHPHNGTDFGAPSGTPIYAARSGTISFLGPAGATGNYVEVTHSAGYITGYAHMSRFVPGMKIGDKVSTRQLIGYVGSTGRSTGPHLHFAAKKDGKFIDAMSLGLDRPGTMPSSDLANFSQVRADQDALLDQIPLPEKPNLPTAPTEEPSPVLDINSEDPEEESSVAPHQAPSAPAPQPVKPAPAQPAKPATKPTPPPAPTPRSGAASLYMTDRELVQRQSGNQDGEVDE